MLSVINDEVNENIDELINVLFKNELYYVELRKIDKMYLYMLDNNYLIECYKKLKKNNIFVSLIDSPIGKHKFDYSFENELFCSYINICKIFKCKYLRIFTDVSDNICEKLKTYNDIARDNNIILLLENEKNTFGDKASNLLEIINNSFSNIFILYDVENYYSLGEDYIKSFNILKDYIKYIHIRNIKKNKYVNLFDGEIEISKILDLIDKDTIVSMETHLSMVDYGNREELFSNNLRRLKDEL